MTSLQNFQPIVCSHLRFDNNCKLCGSFITEEIEAYKTERYRNGDQIYNIRYLKSLRKSAKKSLSASFTRHEAIYSYLERLADKFQFGLETLTLGIYIFNCIYEKFPQNQRTYENEMNLYSGVSLMVAAKAIELDKKIPYYSRFQRYADNTYTKEEYENLQTQILTKLQFDVQIPTFVTFLNYYLTNGLLFSNDSMQKKKVFFIQQKVKQLISKFLKNGDFVSYNQQKFAASIVLKARKQYYLPWNAAMQKYCLLSVSQFEEETVLKSIPNALCNNNSCINIPEPVSMKTKNVSLGMYRPQHILGAKMKYIHSRSVNSSLGMMSTRNRDL